MFKITQKKKKEVCARLQSQLGYGAVLLSQSSQVRRILVEFSLVSSTGTVERLWLRVAVLSGCRPSERQARILLQEGQGGVGPARPAPLHLVHGLGHGGQGGGGRIGVQIRRRAEKGSVLKAVGRVRGSRRRVRGLTA